MRTVVGLFDRFEDAQAAVRDLKSESFSGEDISLVARDGKGDFQRHMSTDAGVEEEDVADGTAKGAGIGALLGGVGGFLVGLGLLAIPGVGPVLAAGPIAAALAGAGMGAVTGGLLGTLVDMGIPDEHAELYSEGVRRGGTLVVVRAQDDLADRAVSILNNHNPVDVEGRSKDWRSGNWQGFDPNADPMDADQMEFNRMQDRQDIPVTGASMGTMAPMGTMDMERSSDTTTPLMNEDMRNHDRTLDRDHGTTIPIIEEDIEVGKRQVDRGGVEIKTNIEETPVNEEVRLRREQVNVERRPVDRPATDADFDTFKEGSVEFRETEERPVVQKTSRVVEEIHVDKTVEENVEHIQDTVRRTNVDIRNTGENRENMGTTGTMGSTGTMGTSGTMGDWDMYDTGFRSHYTTSYGSVGRDYNYYMPAYQYGYTIAREPRYQGYDWNRVEMEARRDWQTRHQDSPWEDIRDAVRHAWETVKRP